jgi:hypothetical protein
MRRRRPQLPRRRRTWAAEARVRRRGERLVGGAVVGALSPPWAGEGRRAKERRVQSTGLEDGSRGYVGADPLWRARFALTQLPRTWRRAS